MALPHSLVALLLAGRLFQAQAETAPKPETPFPSDDRRAHWRQGSVSLNNGDELKGWIGTTREALLRFVDDRTRETYEWPLAQIRRISIEAKESVEPEWRWKESGSDEKVFTGYYYRHADFKITLSLESGEGYSGRWRTGAPILVDDGRGGIRKFLLHNEIKEVSEKNTDANQLPALIYIREIVFHSPIGEKP